MLACSMLPIFSDDSNQRFTNCFFLLGTYVGAIFEHACILWFHLNLLALSSYLVCCDDIVNC